MWQDLTFTSCTGHRCQAYLKVTSPAHAHRQGCVVFLHGWGDHAGRYLDSASCLVDAGFDVLIPDFSGHGRSDGPRARIDDFQHLIQDLHALITQTPCTQQTPPILCGHSMGGCLAFHFAVRYPSLVQGVIFNSAALTVNPTIPRWKRALSLLLGGLAPHLKLAYLKHDWMMSSLAEERYRYNKDALIYHGRIEAGSGRQLLLANQWVTQHMHALKTPFLALQSDQDVLVNPLGPRLLLQQTSHPLNSLVKLNQGRHDLLHDVSRDRALAVILEWLRELNARCRQLSQACTG